MPTFVSWLSDTRLLPSTAPTQLLPWDIFISLSWETSRGMLEGNVYLARLYNLLVSLYTLINSVILPQFPSDIFHLQFDY